jgi:hypothetical protein
MERLSTPTLVMGPGFGCVATSGVRRSERMRREPVFFLDEVPHVQKRNRTYDLDKIRARAKDLHAPSISEVGGGG